MTTYKGSEVTVVRPAQQGDQGYDPALGEQVLLKFPDGHEEIALAADVEDVPSAADTHAAEIAAGSSKPTS